MATICLVWKSVWHRCANSAAGAWLERGVCETGRVFEQTIQIDEQQSPWRRIELRHDQAADAGDSRLWLWSNLPESIGAAQIANLYRPLLP